LITLTDESGLIFSPKSWAEIEEIPGYKKGLVPTKHKLKAIIGSYHLKDIHCGLSECNSPHDKGYIAQTQSGAVTNLGHICGEKYFGIDFKTYVNQHKRDVTEKSHRDLLSTFSLQLYDLENEIKNLRVSADWIYLTSQSLVCRGKECPDEVVQAITAMIKSPSNILKKSRLATEEEMKAAELSQTKVSKPYYIQDNIAVISGLDALLEENNLKNLVVLEIEENIKIFKNLKIDNLSPKELAKWAKWVSSVKSTKDKIEASIDAGTILLKSSNLKTFKKIISNKQDKEKFDIFLSKLPN
jgi:hypothetical protein